MNIAKTRSYKVTSAIEKNTLLNRGITSLFGYSIPITLMSNNKYEARERFSREMLYTLVAFISPLLLLPLLNRSFLRLSKVIPKFLSNEAHIVKLSKKHLVGTADEMTREINKLGQNLEKDHKGVSESFKNLLKRFPHKENLRQTLLKVHEKIFILDFLLTGLMTMSIPWVMNLITKHLTGRSGFSAEFNMADKNYTDKKSEKHEKTKNMKLTLTLGLTVLSSFVVPKIITKGLLTKNTKGLLATIKKSAEKFDYTDGIYMRRWPYFLMAMFTDLPSTIAAARDKYEARDVSARYGSLMAVFFGGDILLNSIFGQLIDTYEGTKLINSDKPIKSIPWHKRLLLPVYSLSELNKTESIPKNVLDKTKKYAFGMYWMNFGIVLLTLGIGLPFVLNKILKNSVKEDLSKNNIGKIPNNYFNKEIFRKFYSNNE